MGQRAASPMDDMNGVAAWPFATPIRPDAVGARVAAGEAEVPPVGDLVPDARVRVAVEVHGGLVAPVAGALERGVEQPVDLREMSQEARAVPATKPALRYGVVERSRRPDGERPGR